MIIWICNKRSSINCILKIPLTGFARHRSTSYACQIVEERSRDNTVSPADYTQALIQQEKFDEVLGAWQCVLKPHPGAFIPLLKICAKSANSEQLNKVYTNIVQSGVERDAFICSALINIYARLGSLEDSCRVFDMACSLDVVLWNAMLAGYTDNGHGEISLCLFTQMQQMGMTPSRATIVAALKSCTSLEAWDEGIRIHILIIWIGLHENMHVASSLINMYGRSNSVGKAEQIFEGLCERDTAVWNVMIAVQVDRTLFEAAPALFEQMQEEGSLPNSQTFLGVLKGCAKRVDLKEGMHIHARLISGMFEPHLHVMNALIDMYAKCVRLKDAHAIFNTLLEKSIISWNVMLMGYVQQGLCREALALYQCMHQARVSPDPITFTTIIKACTALTDLQLGKYVHILIVQDSVHESNTSIRSALIEMYGACKSIEDAVVIFHSTTCHSGLAIWNALLTAYSEQGLYNQALSLFNKMDQEAIGLNCFTFANMLKTCTKTSKLGEGKAIYARIVKCGLDRDHLIITSLVDMFAKGGSIDEAAFLFQSASRKDVALWTSMISGYVEISLWEEAAVYFKHMTQKGLQPDRITLVIALKICAGLADLEWGKRIHVDVLQRGIDSEVSVANTIMDMYIKCDSIDKACEVFKDMTARNIVSWNVLIAGYFQRGDFKEALEVFQALYQAGEKPDQLTFISALRACSMLGALEQGKEVHAQLKKAGYEMDIAVCSTLVDLYIKCGCMSDACEVFNTIPEKNNVLWNSLIAGYAQHGLGGKVRTAVEKMQDTSIVPNGATFSSVLSSCNHEGLKAEGYYWFSWFILYCGVLPAIEIYASLVDLLCRAGCLREAQALIREIPVQPNAILWVTVLGACRFHSLAGFGRLALAAASEVVTSSDSSCFLSPNAFSALETGA